MPTYQAWGSDTIALSSQAGAASATNTRRLALVLRQFPLGAYWDREAGWLPAIARGIARFLSRLDYRRRRLERNVDPRTAEELLDEHEDELGLDDGSDLSLAARRARVLAKRQGGAFAIVEPDGALNLVARKYYEDLAKSLGYTDAVVVDYAAATPGPFQCTSPCTSNLGGGGFELTFIVQATSLGAELDAVLRETVDAEILAGWKALYELA